MAGRAGSQQAAPRDLEGVSRAGQGLFLLWNYLLSQHLLILWGASEGAWPGHSQPGASKQALLQGQEA